MLMLYLELVLYTLNQLQLPRIMRYSFSFPLAFFINTYIILQMMAMNVTI